MGRGLSHLAGAAQAVPLLPLIPAQLSPPVQFPPETITQAAPRPKPSFSQSLSLAQTWQFFFLLPPGAAQNPAFPVVATHVPSCSPIAHLDASSPTRQKLRSGVQPPVLWATHLERSDFPFLGFFPLQMPEQHLLLFPPQGLPTARQALFVLALLFAITGRWPGASPSAAPAKPRKSRRRVPGPVSERVNSSKREASTVHPLHMNDRSCHEPAPGVAAIVVNGRSLL